MATAPPPSPTAQPREKLTWLLLFVMLAGLPAAVWMDTRNLTQTLLRNQAHDLDSVLSSIRGYYSSNVVGRVLAANGATTTVTHNYESRTGAIPLPATLSLELGSDVSEKQNNMRYRFVSDYPFRGRAPHALDEFEKRALRTFREQPGVGELTETVLSGSSGQVRLISPVVMGAACVACHNSHPDSVKTDWKTGDVRGTQMVTVNRSVALGLWSFKYSVAYFLLILGIGWYFLATQRRQSAVIRATNASLDENNRFLASVSAKVSRYLSPQIYNSIFSGELDVKLQTTRKQLTIFFSDVEGFNRMSERLQPEELTRMINDYLDAMASIALKHGGTIDKFIGDAILVFFGDPESRGAREDAKACVRMAIDMRDRLAALNIQWSALGAEEPLRIRIGINSGFCNVGNFGSAERMDYTILGAEANLAARLQTLAPAGGIVVSHETWSLASDMIAARALPPVQVKGFSRDVTPYLVEGLRDARGEASPIINEQESGLHLYLDPAQIDHEGRERVRTALGRALSVLDAPHDRIGN